MYEIKRTVTATVEPVTLTEFKTYILDRSDTDTVNDALLTSIISQARSLAEEITGRSFIAQNIEYTEDIIPDPKFTVEILLPFPNHIAITEMKVNGVASTDYISTGTTRFKITIPVLNAQSGLNLATLYVKYTAGDCHILAKSAILQIAKDLYENRGKDPMTLNSIAILNPLKVYF